MHFIKEVARTSLIVILIVIWSCKDQSSTNTVQTDLEQVDSTEQLTIFFVNDQHGQLQNFAKVKHIVDRARDSLNVLLVCAGDMFSGSPFVDQHTEKGFPMIDVMNKVGFDVSVIGNHEFDYGQEVLSKRMVEAEFQWVCANVDVKETDLPQPNSYVTLEAGDLKVTFLGLVETNGKPGAVIPATHPWRVSGLEFQRFQNVVNNYENLKSSENSDVLIALTHLGSYSDRVLATDYPYFDLIIGGHSHEVINESVNDIPIVQSGSYLNYLGKIELEIEGQNVISSKINFINLDGYNSKDNDLAELINSYEHSAQFDEIVGYSTTWMGKNEVGCFYTTALMEYLETDCSFQNGGGIRSSIDQGDITALEIYNMDPFNNSSVIFTMTVADIRRFFEETGAGEHVSGLDLVQEQDRLVVYDLSGNQLDDSETITIGINDYIPAVYDEYFPLEKADIKDFTTAEAIISYLETIQDTVDYEGCNRYFDFQ